MTETIRCPWLSGGVLHYDPDGAALFFKEGDGRYFVQTNHVDEEAERIWEGVITETDMDTRRELMQQANDFLIERGALHLIYYQGLHVDCAQPDPELQPGPGVPDPHEARAPVL